MRNQGNTAGVFIPILFMFSIGLAAGGCSEDFESSHGVQTETNAGNEAADSESKTTSGNVKSTQEEGICGSCHKEQAKFWAYGGHATVSCETCHSVQEDHIKMKTKPLIRGNEQCIKCHSLVEGREAEKMSEVEVLEHHLQFVEKKHVIKVNREKVKNRCVYCHDPHLGQ